MIISVNGKTGEIYKGSVLSDAKKLEAHSEHVQKKHYKTLTKVYVNLAEPEIASEVAKLDTDGIGLLRAEFMIANIDTSEGIMKT